jgi:hypothetical protein
MNDAPPGVGFSMQQCSLCHMILFFTSNNNNNNNKISLMMHRSSLRVSSRPPWEPACSGYILAPLLVACPPCISVLHNSSDHHISNTSLSYYSQDYPAVKLAYNWWRVFEIDKDENTTHLVGDHINNRYIPSPRRQMISISSPTTTPRTSPAPDRPPSSSSLRMMVHNKPIV